MLTSPFPSSSRSDQGLTAVTSPHNRSEEIPGERELWGPLAVSNYLKVADAEGELASVSYFRLASCYPSFSIQHYFYLMKATYLQNGEEAAHATLDKLILRACYPEHSKKSKEEAVPESLDGQFLSVVCRIIGYYKPDESSRKAESLLVKSALEASQKSKLAGYGPSSAARARTSPC